MILEQYNKFKIGLPKGLLFYGPPGTGKTFIVKKLAEEIGADMVVETLGNLGSSYSHQTTVNIKNFFSRVKKMSKDKTIVLFLDEIDSLISKRNDNLVASKSEEVSQFLQEFGDLDETPNLIVIAATNRPDHLDSAILRSGRLDKKIYVGPPDFFARKDIFRRYIDYEDRPHDKLDYDELARLTEGYVASDIQSICSEVSRDAGNHLREILDLVQSSQGIDDNELEKDLNLERITMYYLRATIKEMYSSLKTTDMAIYEEWMKSIGA